MIKSSFLSSLAHYHLPVPKGHQGARRGAQPVPPLPGHRADHPGDLRIEDAQCLQGRGAVPAPGCVDALKLIRGDAGPERQPGEVRNNVYQDRQSADGGTAGLGFFHCEALLGHIKSQQS